MSAPVIRRKLPGPFRTVPVDIHARKTWPFMAGIVLAVPGIIVEDEASGTRVRVREDGGLEEITAGGMPRSGIAADPSATGRGR